jgi:hypothetical protein
MREEKRKSGESSKQTTPLRNLSRAKGQEQTIGRRLVMFLDPKEM